MRELSREEHELLLNLFILKIRYGFYFEFADWENSEYEELMKSADIITLKDCFQMDEFNKHELVSVGCSYMEDGSVRFNYITRSYNYVEDDYVVKN